MFRFAVSVAWAAALVALSGAVQAATQPVVLVEVPGAAIELREKMRSAAEEGLDAAGVTVPRQLHDPKKEECATAECMAERAKRFGATHILEIQGNYSEESYKLRLEVRAVNGGRILGSESKECEICSARDFVRAIKDRTTTLWTRVAREQASMAQPAAETRKQKTPATNPLVSPPGDEPTKTRMLWQQPLPLVGLGFMLAGVVAMGFGGYYLAVDGETDPDCPADPNACLYQRRTKRLGWGLMAGGGGAVLTGTALVIFGRDSNTTPGVAVGPGRILVSGRF